eukprot:TRINITY_DN57376_c0_g1_i1.p1 TRINITY_DN57376_c0_g1~~TRINITY_DN57376_c0_g1_i1.p1  ORF type:complete len:568 (+),score=107.08 TRINITY_DN57376_c0_g1_i1:125-1828(+)
MLAHGPSALRCCRIVGSLVWVVSRLDSVGGDDVPPGVLIGSDPACWLDGEKLPTYTRCCHWEFGPQGNAACWTEGYSYERCCGIDCFQAPERCRSPAPDHFVAQAIAMAEASGFVQWRSAVQHVGMLSPMVHLEGLNPITSFIEHYGKRRQGLPGYGDAGLSAEAFRWILCYGGAPLGQGTCDFDVKMLDITDSEAAHNSLDSLLRFHEQLHSRGNVVFRLSLQLFDVCILRSLNCPPQEDIAALLASELNDHEEALAHALVELRRPRAKGSDEGGVVEAVTRLVSHPIFVPGLGTLPDILVREGTSDGLMRKWHMAIEAWSLGGDLTAMMTMLVELSTAIMHAAILTMARGFAHYYLTELRGTLHLRGSRLPVLLGQNVVFHPVCCSHVNVLHHLLHNIGGTELKMLEVGVHAAINAEYLLDHVPRLSWVGIDPYSEESGEDSGDAMFAAAKARLSRFGDRARLLRSWSSIAWNSSDDVAGIPVASVDLLFVDGDHSFAATLADLQAWSRFVRPGGLVAGHDIFNVVNDGVTDAVLELVRTGGAGLRPGDPFNIAPDYAYWWTHRA